MSILKLPVNIFKIKKKMEISLYSDEHMPITESVELFTKLASFF